MTSEKDDTLEIKSKGSYPVNLLMPDKMDKQPRASRSISSSCSFDSICLLQENS